MQENHPPKQDMVSIDRLDRRILLLLQASNRASLTAIARCVNSSRSVVQRRISRLRRSRTIRDVSIVRREAVGNLTSFIVHLSVRKERSDLLQNFVRRIGDLPEVQQCYLTTGRANCIVVVVLRDVGHLETFITANFADDAFVRRTHARLVTRELKVGLTVPIDPDD